MKLLGRDIRGEELLEKVQERLQARGLWPEPQPPRDAEQVEPRVDPRGFNVAALEEHADATRRAAAGDAPRRPGPGGGAGQVGLPQELPGAHQRERWRGSGCSTATCATPTPSSPPRCCACAPRWRRWRRSGRPRPAPRQSPALRRESRRRPRRRPPRPGRSAARRPRASPGAPSGGSPDRRRSERRAPSEARLPRPLRLVHPPALWRM